MFGIYKKIFFTAMMLFSVVIYLDVFHWRMNNVKEEEK